MHLEKAEVDIPYTVQSGKIRGEVSHILCHVFTYYQEVHSYYEMHKCLSSK